MDTNIRYGEYSMSVTVKKISNVENKSKTVTTWDEKIIEKIINEVCVETKFLKGDILEIKINPIDYIPCISNQTNLSLYTREAGDNRWLQKNQEN